MSTRTKTMDDELAPKQQQQQLYLPVDRDQAPPAAPRWSWSDPNLDRNRSCSRLAAAATRPAGPLGKAFQVQICNPRRLRKHGQ